MWLLIASAISHGRVIITVMRHYHWFEFPCGALFLIINFAAVCSLVNLLNDLFLEEVQCLVI
jgi:hypothetical protein